MAAEKAAFSRALTLELIWLASPAVQRISTTAPAANAWSVVPSTAAAPVRVSADLPDTVKIVRTSAVVR